MTAKALRRMGNWIHVVISLLGAALIGTVTLVLLKTDATADLPVSTTQKNVLVVAGVVLAVLLLVAAVVRAVYNLRKRMEGRYLVFDTPSGPVYFRASSVEEAVSRTVVAMDEVADASLDLVLPKSAKVPTEAYIRCRLYDRPNLLAIQDQVRATASDRYLQMFPGQEPLPITITVERIVFETPEPKAAPTPIVAVSEAGAEQLPFRPQYPVGD
jgi:hypothetical protein